MYVLTIVRCLLKTYVVRLHTLTLMNIFCTIDHKRSLAFFIIVQIKPKTKKLLKVLFIILQSKGNQTIKFGE